MGFDIKFNIRLLLCVAACMMCWTIVLADSADNGNATQSRCRHSSKVGLIEPIFQLSFRPIISQYMA